MLWDLIRDFFVQHIFGGCASTGDFYGGSIGMLSRYVDGLEDDYWLATIDEITFSFNGKGDGVVNYIGLGDWLSSTATIISITIIVVLCCLFVYKIIKLIGGLIR